jgi:hypothetical protein
MDWQHMKSTPINAALGLVCIFSSACGSQRSVTSLRSSDFGGATQNQLATLSPGLPDYCTASITNPTQMKIDGAATGLKICINCLPGQVPRRSCFNDVSPNFDPAKSCRRSAQSDRHIIQCVNGPGSGFVMDLRRNRAELLYDKLPAALDMIEAFLNLKFAAEPATEAMITNLARTGLAFARAHGRQVLAGKDIDLAAANYARAAIDSIPQPSNITAIQIEQAAQKSFESLALVVAEGNLSSSVLLGAVNPLSELIPALNHFKFILVALLDNDGTKIIEAAIGPYSPELAKGLTALFTN